MLAVAAVNVSAVRQLPPQPPPPPLQTSLNSRSSPQLMTAITRTVAGLLGPAAPHPAPPGTTAPSAPPSALAASMLSRVNGACLAVATATTWPQGGGAPGSLVGGQGGGLHVTVRLHIVVRLYVMVRPHTILRFLTVHDFMAAHQWTCTASIPP